jgi:small subunit ribosomal protein S4
VVYRAGFACNRTEARLLIRHGHFRLNGRKASVASILVRPGDVLSVREKSQNMARIQDAVAGAERREQPAWVESETEKLSATIKSFPVRSDVTTPIEEHLIVELYSK